MSSNLILSGLPFRHTNIYGIRSKQSCLNIANEVISFYMFPAIFNISDLDRLWRYNLHDVNDIIYYYEQRNSITIPVPSIPFSGPITMTITNIICFTNTNNVSSNVL